MASEINEFDICIVGAGLAGSALALALRKNVPQLRIALIEKQRSDSQHHSSFDARALAISYGSQQLLSQWGVWEQLSSQAGHIDNIEITEQSQLGFAYLSAADYQVPTLGYVLEAQMMGAALTQQLQIESEHAGGQLHILCPYDVKSVTQYTDFVELSLLSTETNVESNTVETVQTSGTKNIKSKLLIAADGAQSKIRNMLNIQQHVAHYQQVAITCNVEVDQTHVTAYERFTPSGPMAMLPMQGNRFGLVWCQSNSKAQALLELNDDEFIIEAQRAFGFRAGQFKRVSQRNQYPLMKLIAGNLYKHRCLLLANAAHTIHPIAGQGLNLGLRDVQSIVENIQNLLVSDIDIGSYQAWYACVDERMQDISEIASVTDTLVRLFSNDYVPALMARNQSLIAFSHLPYIKKLFARRAMGLR